MEVLDTAVRSRSGFSTFWGVFSGLLTALLWVFSIPPFEFSEGAYVAFVPLLLWIYTRPDWKSSLFVGFATGWLAWFVILIWLRHVTLFGTVALAAVLGGIFTLWLALVRWVLPRFADAGFGLRLAAFWGLRAPGLSWSGREIGFFGAFPGPRCH